jgi:hypothetical protein
MGPHRRDWLRLAAGGILAGGAWPSARASAPAEANRPLTITGLSVTPIALPDPPLLAASGCHGPYFLRNVVELQAEGGIIGLGETHGGEGVTAALERARRIVVGQNAFAYRKVARELQALGMAAYAGIELACLDACGRATGRRLCELLGGPVRDPVEFAAYLFYRYAADHPVILADPHLVDPRGRGDRALDSWGEVRSAESMAAMAEQFRRRWGFRVFKLKGGVLAPEIECDTLVAMARRLGPEARLRIDPNGRWKTATAVRIGQAIRDLPMEYYEDPVQGQAAMAEVRRDRPEDEHEHVRDAVRPHPGGLTPAPHRRPALRPPLFRRLRRLPGPGADRPRRRLDAQPAQQQPRRHHHGGDDPPGRLDPRADASQRYPLSLARRWFRHHRRPAAEHPGRVHASPYRAGAWRHPRSRQAGPRPGSLPEVRDAWAG